MGLSIKVYYFETTAMLPIQTNINYELICQLSALKLKTIPML